MGTLTPPLESEVSKKKNLGNRTDRRNRSGRPSGVRTFRTRETDRLLAEIGGDRPEVALLKIGRDEANEKPLRVQALAAAAHYFTSRPAPTPYIRFLEGAPELGSLSDADSALRYVASVTEHVRVGKLDLDFGEFFLRAADLFVRLHRVLDLETEVEKHRELAAE